jgi:hypothetical protein
MPVRYSTKHTISITIAFLLLFSLVPLAYASAGLVDSYSESNWSANQKIQAPHPSASLYYCCVGQSFNSSGDYNITIVSFYLSKTSTPTGSAYAVLYSHSGTYGSSSVPDVQLAISDAFNVATLTTSLVLYNFTFSGANQYTMATNTKYVIVFRAPSSGVQTTKYVNVGMDYTSPTHSGNGVLHNSAGWASTTSDICFYVYGEPAVSKAWHDVSTWTASMVARTWSSGTPWSLSLLTRIWNWIPTAWYYIPTTDLIDSYNESNYNYTAYIYHLHPSDIIPKSAEGQSFTMLSSDHMITSCKFYLCKIGSPTGMAHAVLYAHQGIYGTNSTPTGEALATSNDFDVSTLTTSMQLITFTFNSSQQYLMKANTYYCIAFENPWSGTIDVYNCPLMGFEWGSPTHSGNNCLYFNSSYFPAFTSFDTVFYVYGKSFGGFNLLTRQYLTVASWLFDFGTKIWVDAATWTYNLVTMAWENITWIFYLGASIWTDIATWGTNLVTMMWNDVATWVFYPLTMMWRDLTWLFYLLPSLPEWVNVAVWIFSLRSPEWLLVALWNLQLGAGGIAFLFIAILLLTVIVAGIIVIAYRRPKR